MAGDPMRHVTALAQEIGPRPSTGPGEATAARYLAEEMRTWADSVVVERFAAFTSFSWPWMLIYGGAILAAALLWLWPLTAILPAAFAAWAFWGQAHGHRELGWLFPRRWSQNVIGRVRPRLARRRRLLLVAHMDSARSGLVWSPGQVRFFRATFLVSAGATALILLCAALAALGAVAALGSVAALRGWPWSAYTFWGALAVPAALDLLFSLVVLVHRELFCRVTPGANDNASGVAAALVACQELAQARLDHTEVWCVATGCEEVGMVGMHALLDTHRADLSDACFIVLDNLGKGQLKYTTGEGMLRVQPCDPGMVRLAGGLVRQRPEWLFEACVNRLMPTDMGPALLAGYPAIGLRAEDERGLLPHWHWHTDVVENVDPANIAAAASLTVAMARALDVQS